MHESNVKNDSFYFKHSIKQIVRDCKCKLIFRQSVFRRYSNCKIFARVYSLNADISDTMLTTRVRIKESASASSNEILSGVLMLAIELNDPRLLSVWWDHECIPSLILKHAKLFHNRNSPENFCTVRYNINERKFSIIKTVLQCFICGRNTL